MPRRSELAARLEAEKEGGLSRKELVLTSYDAYRAARSGLGEALPEDLGDLDEEQIERLVAAVAAGEAMLLETEDGSSTITWKVAAEKVCHELGIEEPAAADILCAEALLRHLSNAMAFDPEEDGDLATHAASWTEWTAHQAVLMNKRANAS